MRTAFLAAIIAAIMLIVGAAATVAQADGGGGGPVTTGEDGKCYQTVTIVDQEAYDETIIDVVGVAGFWANFSPNDTHGPFEGTPTYPVDAGGTWHVHTNGGPGQDESGVYQVGNGNGDWFYRQQAVAEVSHVEHHDAVTHDEQIEVECEPVIPPTCEELGDCPVVVPPPVNPPKECDKRDARCIADKLPQGVTDEQLVKDSGSRVQGG